MMKDNDHLWSVILAGGEGERLRPLVERWLTRHRPKQYCAFVGTRTMLEHTIARAARLAPCSNLVTVVNRTHLPEARESLAATEDGAIVVQPCNRDTAAGVFLPLAYIRARDPRATVVIYPSDHFVYPEEAFVEAVACAVEAAESTDRLVLLGVAPEGPEVEYGWICPNGRVATVNGRPVQGLRRFVEKPAQNEAREAFDAGGLWNTLVVAAKLDLLWKLGGEVFPDLIRLFEMFGETIGTRHETTILDALYRVMPAYNFSSDLLARAVHQIAVVELKDALWSDWGKPERIAETLRRIGKSPAFPRECLEDVPAPAHTAQLLARSAEACLTMEKGAA